MSVDQYSFSNLTEKDIDEIVQYGLYTHSVLNKMNWIIDPFNTKKENNAMICASMLKFLSIEYKQNHCIHPHNHNQKYRQVCI